LQELQRHIDVVREAHRPEDRAQRADGALGTQGVEGPPGVEQMLRDDGVAQLFVVEKV
jgi:hypothetical protein